LWLLCTGTHGFDLSSEMDDGDIASAVEGSGERSNGNFNKI
jgi:hypothetical protein